MTRAIALLSLIVALPSWAGSPDVTEDYVLHCSACHGLDGEGVAGVVPSLHGVGSLLALSGGRSYLAQVPGVAQAPLSDARLARLLNWVLERWSGTHARPPYSASEIGRLRGHPLRDPFDARAALAGSQP